MSIPEDSPPRRSSRVSKSPVAKLPVAKSAGKQRGKSTTGAPTASVHHEHSAGIILFRQTALGRVYLLLDYGKHWDYPKGHLDPGETAWQAAVRELREETGIRKVDRVGKFQRDMHYFFFSPRKGRISKRVTFFIGQTAASAVALSEEHTGYAWLLFAAALKRLTFPNARALLQAAEKTLNNVAFPLFNQD